MNRGFYWLRSRWSGRLTVAHYDGHREFCWTFIGNDAAFTHDAVIGEQSEERETFELIRHAEPPA